ncbi:hypothetical protein F511_35936 [Dorcoceras hygrometricum]|uniref:Uncharacterized protein n=1 Tax=Dorcoceras hygrometricum TaxID=472368 RepID=A0A2Z7AVV1_9LAMI|nr:hypothetical protein F511_35936 [Dorcoceras hygrometricum]
MRAIKDQIARLASQVAIITIEPQYQAQQVSRWKSSVRDLQESSAHHSSVVFRHDKSVGHHSDDSVGLFRHDKSVCQSQRGSQSGHQSICQAQYIPQMHNRTSWKLESVSKPQNQLTSSINQNLNTLIPTARTILKFLTILRRRTHETDFSKTLRTPVATRFHTNANSGLQMGSNRKINSQRIQRHQNHSNHRQRTAKIEVKMVTVNSS